MENDFIYFVDLDDHLVCNNLTKTNQIFTPYIAHYFTYKTEYPIYTINPDDLLNDIEKSEIGFISPRFQYVLLSNWRRNGLKIGFGYGKELINEHMFNNDEVERISRVAELEIEFEKIRRKIDNNLPSRLSCVFLAENNIEGRVMLKNMFYKKTNFLIASVRIKEKIAFHKADSKWITGYETKKDPLSIENYWKGIEFDSKPEFEYLIEGIIELRDQKDRNYIENNSIFKQK